MAKTCSVDGCDARHFGRGFCRRHYNRAIHSGQLQKKARPPSAFDAPRDFPERPGYEREDAYRSRVLWLAVLLQAVKDATTPPGPLTYRASDAGMQPEEREEARLWLLTYNADFAFVCDLAGLHPSFVRTRARQIIDHKDKLHRMTAAFHPGVVRDFHPPRGDRRGDSQKRNPFRGPSK